jgi:hypothetical protein
MARVLHIVIVLLALAAGNNAIRVDDVEEQEQEPATQQQVSPSVVDKAAAADAQNVAFTASKQAWKAGKEREIAAYNAATATAKDQSASDVQAKLMDVVQTAANDVTALKAREERFGTLTKESGEAFRVACAARKEAHEVIPAAETEALDAKDAIVKEEHNYVSRRLDVVDTESELKFKQHDVGLKTAHVEDRKQEHTESEVDKALLDKTAKQIGDEEANVKVQASSALGVKQNADEVLLAKNAAFSKAQHTFDALHLELLTAENEQKAVDEQIQFWSSSETKGDPALHARALGRGRAH